MKNLIIKTSILLLIFGKVATSSDNNDISSPIDPEKLETTKMLQNFAQQPIETEASSINNKAPSSLVLPKLQEKQISETPNSFPTLKLPSLFSNSNWSNNPSNSLKSNSIKKLLMQVNAEDKSENNDQISYSQNTINHPFDMSTSSSLLMEESENASKKLEKRKKRKKKSKKSEKHKKRKKNKFNF